MWEIILGLIGAVVLGFVISKLINFFSIMIIKRKAKTQIKKQNLKFRLAGIPYDLQEAINNPLAEENTRELKEEIIDIHELATEEIPKPIKKKINKKIVKKKVQKKKKSKPKK